MIEQAGDNTTACTDFDGTWPALECPISGCDHYEDVLDLLYDLTDPKECTQ